MNSPDLCHICQKEFSNWCNNCHERELDAVEEERDKLVAKLKEIQTVGATGQYPHGRVGPDDQGGLKSALYIREGKLVLDFGKPLSWLAMTKAEAQTLAVGLFKKAEGLS